MLFERADLSFGRRSANLIFVMFRSENFELSVDLLRCLQFRPDAFDLVTVHHSNNPAQRSPPETAGWPQQPKHAIAVTCPVNELEVVA